MTDIRPASDFSSADLCAAMNDAFSDYAVSMTLSDSAFRMMMRQRGLDSAASRVALVADRIAAVWLVSVRDQKGYLISSGTRPEFRSRGLARALANDCLTGLRANGTRSFQTEVMDGNETAMALYRSLGMSVSRRLDCTEIAPPPAPAPSASQSSPANWTEIASEVASLRDWTPSWQNDDASLTAVSNETTCLQIRDSDGLAAYAALIPQTATLAQMAVRPDRRRSGLGSVLVSGLQRAMPDRPLRILNAWADDTGYTAFLSSWSAKPTVKQSELFMPL